MVPTEQEEQTFEVEIERLLPGGVGLAHAAEMTVFVSLAAPGDRLRVKIDRVQGKTAFASIVEILQPSPVRIEPPCPYFGRCGGCDFQQLSYQAQLTAKLEIIRDCLHRIAKIEPPNNIRIMPSKQWRYRSRANWQIDNPAKLLGYFERGTNRVCDVEYCGVLVPELEQTLEKVRHELKEGTAGTHPRNVDVVAGDDGVSVSPAIAGFTPELIRKRIGFETYSFTAEAFFQVNHELIAPLIAEALTNARGNFAIDLYAGVGLFTLRRSRDALRACRPSRPPESHGVCPAQSRPGRTEQRGGRNSRSGPMVETNSPLRAARFSFARSATRGLRERSYQRHPRTASAAHGLRLLRSGDARTRPEKIY